MGRRLEIPNYDYEDDGSGNTVVVAAIRNSGDERAETTVTAAVTADDGEERRSADVRLGPGESTEARFVFDLPVSAFGTDDALEFAFGE